MGEVFVHPVEAGLPHGPVLLGPSPSIVGPHELAEPFELTLPAISKHIKVLERAGLVRRGQRAQYRPCALDATPLEEVSTWAEQYRPVWEARFDRMDDYLSHLQPQQKAGTR